MDNQMFCPMMHYMQWGMHPMQLGMPSEQWGMPQMQYGMMPMQYGMEPMQWGMSPMVYDMYDEDERDEEYFEDMHPESCKRIRPYVEKELDRMEGEESPLYDEYVDARMLERMGDKIYDRVTTEIPEMAEEMEGRQFGRRRFLRDIIGVLLLQNLLRRRRRRRRRYDYY